MYFDAGSSLFEKSKLTRISTGSSSFDQLLGGGLPLSSTTDVYGAAGTGKTQFAFQNAIMTCNRLAQTNPAPLVVFVDCTGAFRPERIVEIAENRKLNSTDILKRVYSISVRSVEEQMRVNDKIYIDPIFSNCRLLIVDDATSNFVTEFAEDEIANRQTALAVYMRGLSYIGQKRGASVLLTNSARFRGETEGEATGEVLSQFSLHRMQFSRKDGDRIATLMQPELSKRSIKFVIEASGIS